MYEMITCRKNQVVKVAERIISCTTDIGGGEEGKDVFSGLRKLPELQHQKSVTSHALEK
jgi:hypothetical protein